MTTDEQTIEALQQQLREAQESSRHLLLRAQGAEAERDEAVRKLNDGRDKYRSMVEQCQEFDIQVGMISGRLRESEGREQALAAHVERVRGIRNAIEERCEYLGRPTYYRSVEKEERYEREVEALRDELEEALDEAPTTSLARRDEPFISAVRKLVVAARTSGGTAGRDQGLCSALDKVEEHLVRRQAEGGE